MTASATHRSPRISLLPTWLILAVMAGLSVGLVMLQYKWTGQVAEAEMKMRHGDMREIAARMTREFDLQLATACDAIKPAADQQDFRKALEENWQRWQPQQHTRMFSRIGLAMQNDGNLGLQLLDFATGKLAPPSDWPADWAALNANLEGKLQRGSAPFHDPRGLLLEFPLRSRAGPPARGGISRWLVLEIDVDEARSVWLPGLIKAHFNPGAARLYDVQVDGLIEVKNDAAPSHQKEWEYEKAFNFQGRTSGNSIAMADPAWRLRVRSIPGALDAVVSATRRKNMIVAGALAALLLAAGVAVAIQAQKARQLAQAQMDFVATVSHELRTPLTVIRGAAHNLERGLVQPEQAKTYASMIGQHAHQLTDLVEQVLDFAKAGRTGLNLKLEPLVTSDFLHEILAMARHDPLLAHCTIESDIPNDLPAITADPAALQRAIGNLLTNAAKHSGQPWMKLTARGLTSQADRPHVEISVLDRGPGIPSSEQKSIFHPFTRGEAARLAQTRGSGIGLSVVQEIVAAHRGEIRLHSAAGEGSTFTLILPALNE